MKIKDLIKMLNEFDENEEVVFKSEIESGRSFDYCFNGDVDVYLNEKYEYENFDGDKFDLGRKVVLSMNGNVDWSE